MRKIKIDIRQFAVPCPRIGSIETHSGYGAPPLNGQEIHFLIQKKLEREISGFTSEVPFSLTIKASPYSFIISGRADGVIENKTVEIIEIKTAFDIEDLSSKLIADFNHPYIWQLRTYGYFYFKKNNEIPKLSLKLVSSRNIKKNIDLDIILDLDLYELWLGKRLEELISETKIKEKILKKRQLLAETMAFPFLMPRPGQSELIDTVLSNFKIGSPLLVQAPTGLGKTAGILYPAMKEAFTRGQKVVYVTPKNSQHQVAEKAVDLIADQGPLIKRLTLTSKSKMCLKAEPLCNPHYCEFALDYYKKVSTNDLVNKMGKIRNLSSKKLKKLGETYVVCPFELSVEAIPNADVVIGDYNYVFSPRSLIGRLTDPLLLKKESPNLVIDEAHNLPSRAQDYFSPQISTLMINDIEMAFNQLPKSFKSQGLVLTKELRELIQVYSDKRDAKRIQIEIEPFVEFEKKLREFTMNYLESDTQIKPQDPVLKFSNLCTDFVSALELSGEEFFQTYQRTPTNETLKITCSDASKQLKKAYKEFKNTAAFSATLKPFHYYQELLGLSLEKTKTVEFSSPFLSENRKILMIPQISTKYKDRNLSSPKICEVIERIMQLKKGNYMALFPSFEFMMKVYEKLNAPEFRILLQQKKMPPHLTEKYLEDLREGLNPTLLMGVQGGIFSEGVDYPGNMLIGVFVVGPALPNFDFEREQVRMYYQKRYGTENAFDYAYVFPAMAKAIQSAGRVIRTETDRGIIILIDPRFLETSYSHSMPKEWFLNSPQELLSQQILLDLEQFWAGGIS